jgi:hypothetical protein
VVSRADTFSEDDLLVGVMGLLRINRWLAWVR